MSGPSRPLPAVEWLTLSLIIACHAVWLGALFLLPGISVWLAVIAAGFAAALHSSLTHESVHGHPTRHEWVNAALLGLPLTVYVPWIRFKDTHLAHHHDEILTDPYDDPESNYLDPKVWARLPGWWRAVLRFNNRLIGRLVVGPLIGAVSFVAGDLRLMARGDRAVIRAWAWHVPGLAAVLWIVLASPMPVWAWLLSVWLAIAILKLRTYLEHRAHERASGRTVVIEDRGLFAFMFLNNNFHVVHHMHPNVPWHELPALYDRRRDHYLRRNGGYRYRSYGEVLRTYLWRAKDPVPHPLMPGGDGGDS
ncbi:MAG: fatty acid desaturase [Rubellimicrobium sp.]|nr:fatty acid desaturase [Rubellimicrobium sp.]